MKCIKVKNFKKCPLDFVILNCSTSLDLQCTSTMASSMPNWTLCIDWSKALLSSFRLTMIHSEEVPHKANLKRIWMVAGEIPHLWMSKFRIIFTKIANLKYFSLSFILFISALRSLIRVRSGYFIMRYFLLVLII